MNYVNYIKQFYIYLFIILNIMCFNLKANNIDKEVQQKIFPYVALFIEDSNKLFSLNEVLRKIDFGFINIEDVYGKDTATVGFCQYRFFGLKNIIRLDKEFWNKSNIITKRNLVYHEIAHCLMYLDHSAPDGTILDWIYRKFIEIGIFKKNKAYLDDGCPISLMHPYLVDNYCTAKHNKYYIEELFNRYKKGFNFRRARH
jgi:hypothetical protein